MSKMSNWLKQSSFNVKDEYYTPEVLVKPILKYLKPHSFIWCPFDTENSEFVHALTDAGHLVEFTHIKDGQDFFTTPPPYGVDYIISNPPFSRKLEVLQRLYELDIPFAMLLGLPILNYQEIGSFFLDKELQLLIVNKKVSFNGNPASFNTSYFCYKVLPKDLMFTDIPHTNAKQHYIPSRMHKDIE